MCVRNGGVVQIHDSLNRRSRRHRILFFIPICAHLTLRRRCSLRKTTDLFLFFLEEKTRQIISFYVLVLIIYSANDEGFSRFI